MGSGILHFAGYSPIYSGGSSTKVNLSISTTHIAYLLCEQSQDQIKWTEVAVGLVYANNDLNQQYIIESGSDVRLKLYGGIGEMTYNIDFEDTPPPVPIIKTIGDCHVLGSGIVNGSWALNVGETQSISGSCDGNASPITYKWSIRNGDCISFVGPTNKSQAEITTTKTGTATFRCMFTADASDSPQEKTIAVIVTEPPLGLSASITKEPTQEIDDTGVLTISGNKSSRDSRLTYVFDMDGRSVVTKVVNVPSGSTAIQAATLLINEFTDPDVTVSRTGAAITFAPEEGSFLEKLTVNME